MIHGASTRPPYNGGDAISTTEPRLNDRIRASRCRLIGEDGEQLGIFMMEDALRMADDAALDLVEIAPNADPPVCKIMDYGRYRYEQTKKKHEAKKKQAAFKLKEIKVRPKTGEHDLQVKLGRMREFIGKKDKVKVTVMFRGREIALTQMGRELLERIATAMQDVAAVEQFPKMEHRTLFMVLTPK